MCGRAISRTRNLHGTFRRLMRVGGFFVLLVREPIHTRYPMSTRKTSPSRSLCERLQKLKDSGVVDAIADINDQA